MRFLKILLIIASIVLIGIVLYLFFHEIIGRPNVAVPYAVYIYLSITFVVAAINIVYHIASFHFCRRKEKVNLAKKVPKILWIGGITFSSFLLFVSGSALYSVLRFIKYGLEMKQLVLVISFLLTALLGFLELSLLRKRIKRLQKEQETKDDIETIGSF